MFSLWDALGVPSTRIPISVSALVSYIFPPVVCSFVAAVLALKPHTHLARLALWPIVALLALRAVVSLDMSNSKPDSKALFIVSMFSITTRTLDWALEKEPLVRRLRPTNSSPSIIMDALDLMMNLRGYGWSWTPRLYIPPETRPQDRIAFVFCTLLSAIVHAFAWCLSYQVILSFTGAGPTVKGLSIFDETLPLFLRYLRAGIIAAFGGITTYTILQTHYNLGTIVGIVFLQQDPAQWPPAFDGPWRATSLTDFWGRRWHQWFRRLFLFLGGYPLSIFLGRSGIVLGTFLASGVIHDMYLSGIDSKSEAWRMLAAFGMMGPGVLVERVFYRLTGKRVGGVIGWVWTMVWLLSWNSLMVDGFARAGLIGDPNPFDSVVPLRASIEHAVIGLDAWLHSI